ncbi:MAG: hypothetical protein JXB38_09735 [Anaerolineales bacterium]|nr:hypothetical protein [Anaerolineales bacterium]
MKKFSYALLGIMIFSLLLASCQTTEVPPEPAAEEAAGDDSGGEEFALSFSGAVANPTTYTVAELQGMEVIEVTAEHPSKGEQTNEGVRLNALLDQVGVDASATTLIATAADGFVSEIMLADVQACADCLVAFNNRGTLKLVMPGMEGKAWVTDVLSIEAK